MAPGTGVNVGVGKGVYVGVGVGDGVGVGVGVGVIVGCGVHVGSGVNVGSGVGPGAATGVGVPETATCPLAEGSLRPISDTATAKPMLSTGLPLSVSSILDVLTPITSPSAFTSGPPLLPGLIAASVCNRFTPFIVLVDETIPLVTVRLLPIRSASGKPSASTSSPTRAPFESPTAIG